MIQVDGLNECTFVHPKGPRAHAQNVDNLQVMFLNRQPSAIVAGVPLSACVIKCLSSDFSSSALLHKAFDALEDVLLKLIEVTRLTP